MFELTSFVVFLIAACGMISVLAAPPMEPIAATNNDDGKMKDYVSMNKTTNEKSPNTSARKAMRPFVAVPVYQPEMPLRFQRLAPPTKFDPYGVNPPYVQRPASSYTGYQPPQMYSSYPLPLAPAVSHPIRPVPALNYQHQPMVPSTYNYAPYAANMYPSYGYRSATDDEKDQPPTFVDLPAQPSIQYETVRYIIPETEYQPDNSQSNDYTSATTDPTLSVMEPREMYVMGSQNRYDAMDDKISVNYMSPLAEPYDSVFWEMKRPYGYITRPQTYPDMESHQISYRFTEPSGNYKAPSRPYLIDATNWALPAGQNVPSMYLM